MKLSRIGRCTGKDFDYEHLNFLDRIDKGGSIYFLDHQSLLNSVSCPIKKKKSYSRSFKSFLFPGVDDVRATKCHGSAR